MMHTLKDKKIMIVGGSAGIGLSVAKRVYELGATVVIASRTATEKHRFLEDSVGKNIETRSFDITSDHQTRSLIDAAGHIDHLVITVRGKGRPALFNDTNIDDAKEEFENKFWGSYRLIQMAQPIINPNGSVIMTSGIAGEKIFKSSSTMGVINGAIEILARSLAVELAPIRVNVVSPGFVEPKPTETNQYALTFPQARLATTDEIVQAYLCLMFNTYMTGTIIVVDGGARLI